MALTKEQVQARLKKGTGNIETVPAPELGENAELEVRPLTQTELDDANEAMVKGQKITTGAAVGEDGKVADVENIEMDLAKSAKAQATSERMTVAFGLSVDGERWSTRDAGDLPPRLFKRLLKKIREITDDDAFVEDAASFRGDSSGGDDGDAGDVGDATGDDAG